MNNTQRYTSNACVPAIKGKKIATFAMLGTFVKRDTLTETSQHSTKHSYDPTAESRSVTVRTHALWGRLSDFEWKEIGLLPNAKQWQNA